MKIESHLLRLLFSISGLFVFLYSFGQNYLPGYIIPLNGDTLQGFVDHHKWERNHKAIFFSVNSNERRVKYAPVDIKGFSFKDEIYKSAIIKTGINSSSLENKPGLDFENDTAFLETIFEGSRSLYFYVNKYGQDQFYIKNDTTYELLVFKKYYKALDGKNTIVENKKYIGQLNNYLQDCQSIQSKLNTTGYTKKSLEKLFVYYYESTKSDMPFHKKTAKFSMETGVLSGLTVTSIKFGGNYPSPIAYTTYSESIDFSAGVFFNVIFPKHQGRWSVNNELLYTSYKVDGLLDYYSYDKYSINYTELGFSYMKINTLLRFKYPVGGLFVYLNAGMSNGFAFNVTNYLKIDRTYFSEHTIREVEAFEGPRLYEQGYILGLGTKFRKFSIELRNERGDGISNAVYLSSATNRYYLLLGYTF